MRKSAEQRRRNDVRMARRAVKNLSFQEFSSVEEFRRHWDSSSSGAIAIEDKLPIHLHWTNKQAESTVICFSAGSSKVREVPILDRSRADLVSRRKRPSSVGSFHDS